MADPFHVIIRRVKDLKGLTRNYEVAFALGMSPRDSAAISTPATCRGST
jgi:hypothetical protein